MKLYDEISNILKESPVPPTNSLEQHGYGDDGQPRVALSDTAPEHLKELGDEAILVSEIPLKIKFPDAEDIYTGSPSPFLACFFKSLYAFSIRGRVCVSTPPFNKVYVLPDPE